MRQLLLNRTADPTDVFTRYTHSRGLLRRQFLIDRLDHSGVDLLDVRAGAGQERQVGQLGDAAGDAVGKLVQPVQGRLGEDRRVAAGLARAPR